MVGMALTYWPMPIYRRQLRQWCCNVFRDQLLRFMVSPERVVEYLKQANETVAAKEALGYDLSKGEKNYASITFPENQLQYQVDHCRNQAQGAEHEAEK